VAHRVAHDTRAANKRWFPGVENARRFSSNPFPETFPRRHAAIRAGRRQHDHTSARGSSSTLTVNVERRLPAEPVDQRTGQRHADHHARVRTAQGYGGQSRSLQRRRPVSPDAVASRIRDALLSKRTRHINHNTPCICREALRMSVKLYEQKTSRARRARCTLRIPVSDRIRKKKPFRQHARAERYCRRIRM